MTSVGLNTHTKLIRSGYQEDGVSVNEEIAIISNIATDELAPADRKALIVSHGYTDQYGFVFDEGKIQPVIDDLIQSSTPWVIFSINAGGASNWGNATARTRVSEAVAFARNLGIPSAEVYGMGVSMGNLNILNAWRADNTLFRRTVGIIPIVSLSRIRDNNVESSQAVIDAAYGGTYVTATEEATADPEFYTDSANNADPFGATGDWLGFGSGADQWQVTPFAGNPWDDVAAASSHMNFHQITAGGTHDWGEVQMVPASEINGFLIDGTLPT